MLTYHIPENLDIPLYQFIYNNIKVFTYLLIFLISI